MADSKTKTPEPTTPEEVIATSSDSRFSKVTASKDPEIPSDAGPQLVEQRGTPSEKTEAI